ncbi:ATP-binding protein [Methylotuvimicrobium sp. KM1]|uniref:ATP-binding protein n=1 Tax=Methylotuvimicrobium sp. KM1 TaxID=3377707 RepID=UPI0038505F44
MSKKLPIGIQTFREIREDDCYYVDKTAFALKLAVEGKYYFLSRPRRFGKSLFLDTLAELFAGNEALFQGLYCHDKWDWTKSYPVIRISFGGGLLKSETALEDKLEEIFRMNAERLGVSSEYAFSDRRFFAQLIQRASEKYDQRVVILIDEYDKPILDNITNPDIARQMRDGLRNLYSVIKDSDAFIRFAFLTGVSKFSKVSLFSGLNNLEDITVNASYSALCGYSETDVDTVFAPELEGLDRGKIKDWYNGYNWMGEPVYNPFDLLLLFRERQFKPFWFETGTPTFLVDLLMQRGFFTPDFEKLTATETLLSTFDVDHIASEALLFQTGYLTIVSTRNLPGMTQVTLGYPNLEVKASLNGVLLQALTNDPARYGRQAGQLYDLLLVNDFEGLQNLFTAFYAGIPHDWYRNNPIAQYEGYYASVFYSYFAALGLTVTLEDATNHGRIDMTVHFNGKIYLFEFKVVELVPEGKALKQLKDKNYAEKYKAEGVPIHLIGIEFSKESRSVVGFDIETLGGSA